MLGRTAFGRIGDAAGKERLAATREILGFGEGGQGRNRGAVEVCLGEIETDIGDVSYQRLQPPLRIGSDQVGQLLRLPVGKSLPGVGCGRHGIFLGFPFASSEVETPRA